MISSSDKLCENYLCRKVSDRFKIYSLSILRTKGLLCDGNQDCENNMDEHNCDITMLRSGLEVNSRFICDDTCNTEDCEDEAYCNGLTYGIYCKNTVNLNKYVPPYYICDDFDDCDDGEDEFNCTTTDQTMNTCTKVIFDYWDSYYDVYVIVPVHNFTKCGLINKLFIDHYCVDEDMKKEQTNCTDQAREGGSCIINGYKSTFSKYVICMTETISQICDDRLESQCHDFSKSCVNKHKHVMCDNIPDCNDRSDETHPICRSHTEDTCQRKVGKAGELTLPLTWLGDGIEDCANGIDELDVWPTCGKDVSRRLVTSNKTCENVLLCPSGDPGFVELNDLCDGLETCGNEKTMCSLSQDSSTIFTSVSSKGNGFVKQLSFCMKGLRSINNLKKDNCAKELFIFPDLHFFGVDTKTELHLPDSLQNCDHMYGEQYVFTSCTERCENSICPLTNLPKYDACPNQYPNRIGTLANNKYLVFFTKFRDNLYTNKYFVCDNNVTCINYSQVCDLVDNCGDRSDELVCTNGFTCDSTRILTKVKKCDGNFDCFDMSDECNQQCSRQILENVALKVSSLVIGGLAVLANLIIIIKNIGSLKHCRTSVALANKSLIILISLGDFLVGCYLLVIAMYDAVIFKKDYCKSQIEWMTSIPCSAIGVVSTIGSQISLFAMAGLSTIRLNGIRGSLRVPSEVNFAKSLKVILGVLCIIMTSAAIAITPIISSFENLFVNGYKFADELRLFIGTQSKQEVIAVLEAYYGRMKRKNLSWEAILKMYRGMFSHDEGYPDHTNTVTKLDFYGNDGVCLFKYFVDKNDPQRNFVWAILAVNFVCFLFISISYVLIGIVSRDSSKGLANSQNNRQIRDRNRKMNRRITIIITTDFCCWVPFIVICVLHFLEVLDATPWYSIFSMIILPINSVINPFLYDDFVTGLLSAPFNLATARIANSAIYRTAIARLSTAQTDVIEMEQIEVQRGEPGCTAGSVPVTKTREPDEPKIVTGLDIPLRNAHKRKQLYVGDGVTGPQNQARDEGGELTSTNVTGEDGCALFIETDGVVRVEVHNPLVQQSLDHEVITQTINMDEEV